MCDGGIQSWSAKFFSTEMFQPQWISPDGPSGLDFRNTLLFDSETIFNFWQSQLQRLDWKAMISERWSVTFLQGSLSYSRRYRHNTQRLSQTFQILMVLLGTIRLQHLWYKIDIEERCSSFTCYRKHVKDPTMYKMQDLITGKLPFIYLSSPNLFMFKTFHISPPPFSTCSFPFWGSDPTMISFFCSSSTPSLVQNIWGTYLSDDDQEYCRLLS